MAYNGQLTFNLHRKQKKDSWPPVPGRDQISSYEGQACITFEHIQVIDIFLLCFAAVETAPCRDAAGTMWLKHDRQNFWFNGLKKASASLVVDVAKVIVDGKAAARTAAKDLTAQPHLEPQARKELPRLQVRDILRLHQNFKSGSSSDGKELWSLVFKLHLNVKVPFQFATDLSTFWGSLGKNPVTLQGLKLGIDETALHVREAEECLETTATMDPAVEAQEDKASGTFLNEYETNVADLESKFGMTYDRV